MTDARVAEILAHAVAGDGGLSVLQRLCCDCAVALGAAVGLSLTTATGGGGIVGATDAVARRMEEAQFAVGEGPCVEAVDNGRPVMQPHLAETGVRRWPGFAEQAVVAGVVAVFALPLQVGAIKLGALGVYRGHVGPLTSSELADALAYADAGTLLALHLQVPSSSDHGAGRLAEALDDRAEVHQATGMISVQLRVGLPEALLRLRAHAYAHNRSVADVAAHVIERRLRFDHSDAGHIVEDD